MFNQSLDVALPSGRSSQSEVSSEMEAQHSRDARSHRLFDSLGTAHRNRTAKRPNYFGYRYGQPVDHIPNNPVAPEEKMVSVRSRPGSHLSGEMSIAIGMSVNGQSDPLTERSRRSDASAASLPRARWLQQADKVLRFQAVVLPQKGGIEQTSLVSPAEVLRRCTVYYYQADDSWEIREAKVENSGFPAGLLIGKRPAAVALAELKVGAKISVGGIQLIILDCDRYTRSVLPDQPPALDLVSAGLLAPVAGPHGGEEDGHSPRVERLRRENRQSPVPPANGAGALPIAGQLVFFLRWQDRGLPEKYYKAAFWPSDGTMEVRELGLEGYAIYAVLLRRQRVRKEAAPTRVDAIGHGSSGGVQNYVTLSDLRVGHPLYVQGRAMQVVAATEETYTWLERTLLVDMRPDAIGLPASIIEQMENQFYREDGN